MITPRIQVFALDAATGHVLWQYKYPTPRPGKPGGMTFLQNRGVAVGDGKVFFGTTDNFVVALDQKTGAEQWKVSVDDPRQCGCDITAAPLVVKDKVIVGGTGGDAAHRGYLTAFYTKTGLSLIHILDGSGGRDAGQLVPRPLLGFARSERTLPE